MSAESKDSSLSSKLEYVLKESVYRCYQCGKCSAGCPLAEEMDYTSSHILRMLQLELPQLDDKVLRSYSIWLCVTCETCVARCPQEVGISRIMDFLRSESLHQKKMNPRAKDIISFHKSFLDFVRHTGRMFEIGAIADYKMRTLHLFQDILMAPKLFLRGKLRPFPHIIKNRSLISRIFAGTSETQERKEQEK